MSNDPFNPQPNQDPYSPQTTNPYAATTDGSQFAGGVGGQRAERPSRLTRFGARFVDGLLGLVVSMPIMFATGYFQRAMEQKVSIVEVIGYTVLGMIIYCAMHGYTLATKGQTLGKLVCGVRIAVNGTGEVPPIVKTLVMRELLISLIASIPFVGGLLVLVDSLSIFSSDARCIHDHIAGTEVLSA